MSLPAFAFLVVTVFLISVVIGAALALFLPRNGHMFKQEARNESDQ